MKKKIKYTEEPMDLEVIKDFLPPPEELVFSEELTRVTLYLDKTSIQFFKKQARRYGTKYQKMIRNLLDQYVRNFSKKS